MKGISPGAIAIILACIVTGGAVATILSLLFIDAGAWQWLLVLTGSLVIFFSTYLFAYQALKRFVSDKIRIIYKSIRTSKGASGKEFDFEMSEDIISQVNNEVLNWVSDRRDEIQQLKEQEAFRREFIGNLAHELKTPIFSIQGYILTLLEGGLEDENINRRFLERAAKGVERMTGIIEDLDKINKFESGQFQLDIQTFNLKELAEDVMHTLEMKALENGVKMRFNRAYESVLVEADEGRIGQVLTNLLVNSIHYNEKGGYTEIRFFDMDENILVEVADNGMGIASEHLPRLFERFYRVGKSRSRDEGGTGLGLSIVKHIVESHGQSINVRSTAGIGSTFSFTLKKA